MLKFILPTGSLAHAVRTLLKTAGYDVPEPDRRGYCGVVNGIEFHQLDRRTVPNFLMTGKYDAGITGRDLLIASCVYHLKEICTLQFSRSSNCSTRWVLAKREGFNAEGEVVIGCELPHFAEKILESATLPFPYRVVPIYGSEEQCVRDGIVHMILVITETGKSLTTNGLVIVDGCDMLFESMPVIVARWDFPDTEWPALKALSAALRSALGARQKVMVVCDIPSSVDIPVLALPSVIAPTIAPLTEQGWCSCTICISVSEQGRVLSTLEDAGARGIVVVPVQGYLA